MRECRAAGMSYRAIATELGCSVGTVYRVMNKT
ncbi:helix-turn-helix domain-containing protein [Jatrophihabitans sp. DSM 45814]